RVFIADGDELVVDLAIEDAGDEAGADALDGVEAGLAAGEDGGAGGLDGDDADAGELLLQDFADAGDRAAGADAGDEGVEPAGGVVQDLEGGRAAVDVRIRGIVELLGHEVALVLADHVLGGVDGAGHALDRRGEDELGAEALEKAAALVAVVVGHGEDDLV